MSKLHKNYLALKAKNPNHIYLFKSGIFYLFLDQDATLMSPILHLKLGKLNEEVVKCGFPVASLEKYQLLLHNLPYEVEIINSLNRKYPLSS